MKTKTALGFLGFVYIIVLIGHILAILTISEFNNIYTLLFFSNSLVKVTMMAIIVFWALLIEERRKTLLPIIIFTHLISAFSLFIQLSLANSREYILLIRFQLKSINLIYLAIVIDLIIAVIFIYTSRNTEGPFFKLKK